MVLKEEEKSSAVRAPASPRAAAAVQVQSELTPAFRDEPVEMPVSASLAAQLSPFLEVCSSVERKREYVGVLYV